MVVCPLLIGCNIRIGVGWYDWE